MNEALSNHDDDSVVGKSSGMTRRSMVKTGAHLAWAVPAVSIVSAAPAFAASGPPELEPPKNTTANIGPQGGGAVNIVGMKNSGGEPLKGINAFLNLSNTNLTPTRVLKPWYFGSSTPPKASRSSYILFTAASVKPGGVVPPLKVKLQTKKGKVAKGKIKYRVAAQGTSTSGTIPVS